MLARVPQPLRMQRLGTQRQAPCLPPKASMPQRVSRSVFAPPARRKRATGKPGVSAARKAGKRNPGYQIRITIQALKVRYSRPSTLPGAMLALKGKHVRDAGTQRIHISPALPCRRFAPSTAPRVGRNFPFPDVDLNPSRSRSARSPFPRCRPGAFDPRGNSPSRSHK